MARGLYTLSAFVAARWLARVSPRGLLQAISGIAGRRAARDPEVLDAVRVNLARVTGLRGLALERLCRQNIANFSRMLADYFYCSAKSARRAGQLLERWEGSDNLSKSYGKGRGLIIATAHLGNWELGGILLALRGLPMTVVTLDEPTAALTSWREAARRRFGIKTIAVGPGREFSLLEMVHTLQRGECLAMLVDRPYHGAGTSVNFFGRQTDFSTAPALLWSQTGAPVVPAYVVRSPRGRYISFAGTPVPMVSAPTTRSGLAPNTQAVASVFESIIRSYPEQWFNYVPIWPLSATGEAPAS